MFIACYLTSVYGAFGPGFAHLDELRNCKDKLKSCKHQPFGAVFASAFKIVKMTWEHLKTTDAIANYHERSFSIPVLIYKHSNRCGVCTMVKKQLEKGMENATHLPFLPVMVSVIEDRETSQALAEKYQIRHESPQTLLIINGECVYHASHYSINYEEILSLAGKGA
jgi:bacillithiol system protein YtxJ